MAAYDAFVSYSRADNVDDRISELVSDIQVTYRKLTGKSLVDFMDVSEIETSDQWREKVDVGLQNSALMIAFLSASYFRSKFCATEWEFFVKRATKRKGIIYPIVLYPYDIITDFSPQEQDRVAQAREIQLLDITEIPKGSDSYRNALEDLCKSMYEKLAALAPAGRETTNVHVMHRGIEQEFEEDEESILEQIQDEPRAFEMQKPVCVIYTGGTVGMVRSEPEDRHSTLKTGGIDELIEHIVRLSDLEFDIDFYSYAIPLDSSNIGSKDWIQMARLIELLYEHYQGFVILHGTDTMAYTASAMSFMFDGLAKPVIITGAERPIAEPGSDAQLNVIRAIQVAAPEAIQGPNAVPEVSVLFGKKLLRGNRTKKLVSLDFEGFDSPNCPALGMVEDTIELNEREIRRTKRSSKQRQFSVTPMTEHEHAVFFEVYPDMQPELFADVVTASSVKGIILKTYGTGNAPTVPLEFLEMVRKAVQAGKIVVNLTQCPKGRVEVRLFETNARLFDLGVVNGGDMTTEAAYCKLKWLLSKHRRPDLDDIDIEAVKQEMQIDLKGELRYSAFTLTYRNGMIDPIFYGEQQTMGSFNPDEIDHAFLRIQGVKPVEDGLEHLRLRIYFNRQNVDKAETTGDLAHKIGQVYRKIEGKPITQNMRATNVVTRFATPSELFSLQVVSEVPSPVSFDLLELTIFTQRR